MLVARFTRQKCFVGCRRAANKSADRIFHPLRKESAMGKGNNSQKNDKKNKKPKKGDKKTEIKPAGKK